ncbi:MAG: CrcB family protein [Acetobacteraceae bacterium]|nr:CrcB family protein [Acetobacteraceae bacterium]
MGRAAGRKGKPAAVMAVLLVGLGGAAGSILRYLVSAAAHAALGVGFPWGTLAVNAIGSAAIGALASLGLQHHERLLLVTGLLGGFTTFSAFSLETALLWQRAPWLAAVYVGASLGGGFAGFAAGQGFARGG